MITTSNESDVADHAPIGLLLRKLDWLINERFERTLGARGITRRQWQLLHTLAERPSSVDVLTEGVAPFLDLDAGETARQHIEPLVEQGLVRRNQDLYEMTDLGRTLFESLAREVQDIRDLTVAGLSEGEYERTLGSLQIMVDNLETRV